MLIVPLSPPESATLEMLLKFPLPSVPVTVTAPEAMIVTFPAGPALPAAPAPEPRDAKPRAAPAVPRSDGTASSERARVAIETLLGDEHGAAGSDDWKKARNEWVDQLTA